MARIKLFTSTGDTTTTTGTGALTGAGTAPTGYLIPASAKPNAVVNNDETIIRVQTSDGTTWEVCYTVISEAAGVYTYSRGTLVASSTGSRINFGAGTKDIYFTLESPVLALEKLTTTGDILYHNGTTLARLGVGTTGQSLKVSGGLPSWDDSSPLTTKGDIHTYSTVDARLPVGTNEYSLFAASGETTGLKWGKNMTAVISCNMDNSVRWLTTTLASGATLAFGSTGGLDIITSATSGGNGRARYTTTGGYSPFDGNIMGSFIFQTQLEGTNFQAWFGHGGLAVAAASITMTGKHIGFELQRSGGTTTLYASNANGTTQTQTSITGYTTGVDSLYQIVKDGTTQVRFYVDGVLKATHTTNIPSGTNANGMIGLGLTNRSTASSTIASWAAMDWVKQLVV